VITSTNQKSSHVVLLGDSIFANAAYTHGGPDVLTHLQRVLPVNWRGTLCAVDGATTRDLASQLASVPSDASHLVVSIGGNDALQNSDLLSMRVASSAQALQAFADRLAPFERAYRSAIRDVVALGHPTAVCTIYNGALERDRAAIARLGVALFNDAILRTAMHLGLDIVELRTVCTDPADYANPIEPSVQGGLKIARTIARAVGATNGADAKLVRLWGGAD
jgi:GDSL-like Lipase/Acylhydrolase family